MVTNSEKKFEKLNSEEKEIFVKHLKLFLAFNEDIKEAHESQKKEIEYCADNLKTLSKKDVRKMFNYYKRGVTSSQLREDADILDEISGNLINESEDDVNLDV